MTETPDARPPLWTGHVFVYSADLAALAHFYEKIGMRTVAVFEQLAAMEMRGGTHLLMRHDPDQVGPGRVGWDLMVDDIDAIHDKWQAEGVPVTDIVIRTLGRPLIWAVRDGPIAEGWGRPSYTA